MAFPSRPSKRPTLADIVSRPGSAVGARRPQDAAVPPPPPKTQPPAEQVQMDMEYSTTRMIVIYCNGLYIYITYAYIIITIMIMEFMIMIME